MTVEEVAELLAAPQSWVYRKARENGLPFIKIGKYVRFEPSAVKNWVESQRRGS